MQSCQVLDIACGTGYGINILLRGKARQVVGVDLDRSAVEEARQNLSESGGHVLLANGCSLPFPDQSFDAITSFETLEHLNERDKFLMELRRVLKPSGLLILSTPNANHTEPINGRPRNPFHVYEYTPQELETELRRHFDQVKMLGQVLDSRFVIPPFIDEQEKLTRDGRRRMDILLWRALNKLPRRGRNRISQALWGQPFFPDENDYRFNEETLDTAPVLLALCRNA